jgi:tellurite resistance protein
MPSRERIWEFGAPNALLETKRERADKELFEARRQIEDLKHKLSVAERTARVAASLLLKKKV